MLLESSNDEDYHEPASIAVTRLLCQTAVVLTVLLGSGLLLWLRPEYSSAALALIGVVVGACFGLVRLNRPPHRNGRTNA